MASRNYPSGLKNMFTDPSLWDTVVMGLAELLGTAILVFIGCLGCGQILLSNTTPPHLQIALTFGFALACVAQTIGHISNAHVNPAVTIGFVILGLKSVPGALIYIIGQLLGGVIGYGTLMAVTPAVDLHTRDSTNASSFCVTRLSPDITPIQGLLVETVATGVLMLFICGCLDPRNANKSDSTAIKFGLTLSTLGMAVGPYTGCSLNPARSFGPALWHNDWREQWVYWLGPISGAVLTTLVYKTLFWPVKSPPADIPEAVPLEVIDTNKNETN